MYRFTKILFVPLAKRDNPAAVRRVADLADKNNADLTVLGVVAEPSRLQRLLDQPLIDQAVRDAEQHALVERLEACCEEFGLHRTSHVVHSGTPPLVIIEEVLRSGHDLVVVTSDEDREDRAVIKRLLRKCPCPVWVIRPTRAKVQRVLAAVNPVPEEAELNRQVLELSSSMVELYGGELHVVHAWELQGEATMRNSSFIHTAPGDIDRLLADTQLRHRNALDELIASTGIEAEWMVHLIKGRAAEVIVELVTRKRINALVMGTVARTGVAGLLVGNTAEQLFDDVGCSLLAVKPPGFVSPVTLD